MISIVHCRELPHHLVELTALKKGFDRHGLASSIISPGDPHSDLVCCWGWRVGQVFPENTRVLVMELGYIGDRMHWRSLGWNGLNGRATFPRVIDGGERWIKNFPNIMQAWNHGDDYILLIGQVSGDSAVAHVDIKEWYRKTANELTGHGLPIRFRPHPNGDNAVDIPGVSPIDGSLQEALAGARWAVTFNSNAGVDAVLAGIPTVTCDAGTMAWEVTGHSPGERPPAPARWSWASHLAFCQWTHEEIEAGTAWEFLRECIPAPGP